MVVNDGRVFGLDSKAQKVSTNGDLENAKKSPQVHKCQMREIQCNYRLGNQKKGASYRNKIGLNELVMVYYDAQKLCLLCWKSMNRDHM